MSKVWTGSKCAVLTGAREAKSLDHLAKYVPLGQLVGELAQVVVGVQQARDGVHSWQLRRLGCATCLWRPCHLGSARS